MARRGKTLQQQCKYYNCDDFVSDVMMYHFNCGNKKDMVDDYKELCKEAKQEAIHRLCVMCDFRKIDEIITALMFG